MVLRNSRKKVSRRGRYRGKNTEGERQGTLRALVRARTHGWEALREVCV